MQSIERRLRALEIRRQDEALPTLFIRRVGVAPTGGPEYTEPSGFAAGAITVRRLPGEATEALEQRCSAQHPEVRFWLQAQPEGPHDAP